jgi:hypothetical protein
MRKETLRRGTAAYNLAKAQGRLPSQKKAKKKAVQGPKTKAMSTPTAQQAGEQLMDTFRKLPKVDNKAPISRQVIKEDEGSTTRTGSPGSTKASTTSKKANNGSGSTTRTGANKQNKNRSLFGNIFGGTFTSRGNRSR